MKVVAIAAAKGGVGKSSIASSVAARASRDVSVGMIDLNVDQATLSQWWVDRGEPDNPALITDISDLARDIKALRKQRACDWIVIDTPPLEMDLIEAAVMVSDVVIVPARTSMFDLDALEPITELCERHRTPCRFMLSAVDPRFKKLTTEARHYLADLADAYKYGAVSEAHTSYKQSYMNAPTRGKSAAEIDKSVAAETDRLWAEIQAVAGV